VLAGVRQAQYPRYLYCTASCMPRVQGVLRLQRP
jgi:hypothetical protein